MASPVYLFAFITASGMKKELGRNGDHTPQHQGTNLQPDWGNRIATKPQEAFLWILVFLLGLF